MSMSVKRVAVTGGAGNIAYSILFRIANGDMLGYCQPISLHLLEVPEALKALEGIRMELCDCAFPLLKEIHISSNPEEAFYGADYALLIGSKPRGPGMERSELLRDNGKIFVEQGKALNAVANENVKVLVVGNPCNTNCLIAMNNAPRIPRKNFHAMTRLDQNRAKHQLASKADTEISEVQRMIIWGNHSNTQVPDFINVKIKGQLATEVIQEAGWFESTFIPTVQNRGAAIIKAREKSSAASAAAAAIDAIKALVYPTPEGECFSSGVCSDQNSYGIHENLIFSFPCRSKGNGDYEIIPDLPWNSFLKEKIKMSEQELIEEKQQISAFLT